VRQNTHTYNKRGRNAHTVAAAPSNSAPPPAPLRLFPLPEPPLPPRIEHIILPAGGPAAAVLAECLSRSDARIDELAMRQLIQMGAVYYAPTPPPPPPLPHGDVGTHATVNPKP